MIGLLSPLSLMLGDSSFALYLSHRFTLWAATLLLLPILPATLTGACIYVATVCVLALAVGLLTHLTIERPLMRVLDRPGSTKVPV